MAHLPAEPQPLTAHYNDLKGKYTATVLLFEGEEAVMALGDDAFRVSRVIGTALTVSAGGRYVITGFPKGDLDKHLKTLVNALGKTGLVTRN